MRPPKEISKRQAESLRRLLDKTKTKADFQRVQSVWLRAALKLSSAETATAVGWSQSTVKIIQSRYLKDGEKVLLGKGRGGKRYSNLSELDSLVLPEVNAWAMSLFLEEVSSRHADEFILMIMDQAGRHRAEELRIPENMRIIWLPVYSPQCNPVEHLWEEIREKWFENKVFNSLDAVEDMLVEALSTLENDKKRVLGLAGFDWLISMRMNAT